MHLGTGLRGKIKEFKERNSRYKKITFEGAGISKDMFDWISEVVPKNGTIIEFGAGYTSTKALSERFKLYSVEHDSKFLNIYESNYIHAPLEPKYGWYDREKIQHLSEVVPSLVLIDGPPGTGKRFGVLKNLDLVKKADYIVIDDTHRPSERLLAEVMAEHLNLSFNHLGNWSYLSKKIK
jgi:hypothetical protein